MNLKKIFGLDHPSSTSTKEEALHERERRDVDRRLRTLQMELDVIKRSKN